LIILDIFIGSRQWDNYLESLLIDFDIHGYDY